VLWGTDWPHPVLGAPMPDDGALVDYLWRVIPEAARRHAALVENPARLYGF
jgi:predicted TIM-barrel fold metal-dependent hydrolase